MAAGREVVAIACSVYVAGAAGRVQAWCAGGCVGARGGAAPVVRRRSAQNISKMKPTKALASSHSGLSAGARSAAGLALSSPLSGACVFMAQSIGARFAGFGLTCPYPPASGLFARAMRLRNYAWIQRNSRTRRHVVCEGELIIGGLMSARHIFLAMAFAGLAACATSEPVDRRKLEAIEKSPICVVIHREAARNYASIPELVTLINQQLAFWESNARLLAAVHQGDAEELNAAAQVGLERNVAGFSVQERRTFIAAMLNDCADWRYGEAPNRPSLITPETTST